jgi:uncharacterized protein
VPIFLPVAGRCLNLFFLAGVGAAIGFISGLFGVGGGFLLTPILIMSGVPATVAVASGSCEIVATSSSGMAAHFRLGHVDAKMGSLLLAGGLAGSAIGVEVLKMLHAIGKATLVITLTYVVVLGALGGYMFFQSLRTLRRGAIVHRKRDSAKGPGLLSRLPWQMDFPRSGVRHSLIVPLVLGTSLGTVAAMMGVGGGFIMLPMMVYLLGMPMHVAVGTSLFQILFSSAGTTYLQAVTNSTVDLLLVLPLAAGSALGAQWGARLSRLLRGEQLMILLAIIVLAVTGEMVSRLVLRPSTILRQTPVLRGHVVEPSRPSVALRSFILEGRQPPEGIAAPRPDLKALAGETASPSTSSLAGARKGKREWKPVSSAGLARTLARAAKAPPPKPVERPLPSLGIWSLEPQ